MKTSRMQPFLCEKGRPTGRSLSPVDVTGTVTAGWIRRPRPRAPGSGPPAASSTCGSSPVRPPVRRAEERLAGRALGVRPVGLVAKLRRLRGVGRLSRRRGLLPQPSQFAQPGSPATWRVASLRGSASSPARAAVAASCSGVFGTAFILVNMVMTGCPSGNEKRRRAGCGAAFGEPVSVAGTVVRVKRSGGRGLRVAELGATAIRRSRAPRRRRARCPGSTSCAWCRRSWLPVMNSCCVPSGNGKKAVPRNAERRYGPAERHRERQRRPLRLSIIGHRGRQCKRPNASG